MQFHLHSLGIPAPRPAPASARPVATSFLVALPAIATDMDNSSAFMPVAVAAVVVVVAVAVAAAASAVLVSTLDLHKARSTAQDVVSDKPNLFCLFEETTEDVEASRHRGCCYCHQSSRGSSALAPYVTATRVYVCVCFCTWLMPKLSWAADSAHSSSSAAIIAAACDILGICHCIFRHCHLYAGKLSFYSPVSRVEKLVFLCR